MGEETGTLEEVYEPFLIQEGFLQRTTRGRVATARAYERFGYTVVATFEFDVFPHLSLDVVPRNRLEAASRGREARGRDRDRP